MLPSGYEAANINHNPAKLTQKRTPIVMTINDHTKEIKISKILRKGQCQKAAQATEVRLSTLSKGIWIDRLRNPGNVIRKKTMAAKQHTVLAVLHGSGVAQTTSSKLSSEVRNNAKAKISESSMCVLPNTCFHPLLACFWVVPCEDQFLLSSPGKA